MKIVFNLRPAIPRYHVTWNPDIVLQFLESWHPPPNITLKQLTQKTALLLVLLSGRRGNTIINLHKDNVSFHDNEVHISIGELTKTSSVGRHEPEIILASFQNKTLCIVEYLQAYFKATENFRGSSPHLLLSFVDPHKGITTSTLSRWVREVMSQSGIDINRFRPHSTRSAAASHDAHRNVSLATILASVGWRSQSTFARHYNKPLLKNQGEFWKAMEPSP
ncbi:tyrosine recombinase XerD [Elysia marginata]|uniref:Tyrosine recombinase XerD n=1 Tax=Elysia marginata TaxID=1093978 RepID=A0AAV4G4E1_9GAST|nr:tyrosine recombinase XerD [Elysia marginata]